MVPGAIVFPSYCVTYDDDGRPLPCEVSILCSWCSCPRICSHQAAPGREIPDKILAKLGAEICGCKKQGNVNTTHESYGLEVKQRGGGVLGENVVEIEKMREAKKPGSRSAAHDWASRQCVVYLPLSLGDKLTDSDANVGLC